MDEHSTHTARYVDRALASLVSIQTGRVMGYNATTHQAQVQIEPYGALVDELQVMTPWLGLVHPLRVGDQCLVACVENVPLVVLGVYHSKADTDAPPNGSMSMEGDAFIGGRLEVAGGVRSAPAMTLPAPTPADRGMLRVAGTAADGIAGSADALYFCGQRADGVLVWTLLATAT